MHCGKAYLLFDLARLFKMEGICFQKESRGKQTSLRVSAISSFISFFKSNQTLKGKFSMVSTKVIMFLATGQTL